MNILERTTTEEYDEDGRLTSRTTVEKYAPEKDAQKPLKCKFGLDCPIEEFAFVEAWPDDLEERCPLGKYESRTKAYKANGKTVFELCDYCKHLDLD